ncbi:MAG: DUF2914 domain-containing protein [Desulfobacterales bacterium]
MKIKIVTLTMVFYLIFVLSMAFSQEIKLAENNQDLQKLQNDHENLDHGENGVAEENQTIDSTPAVTPEKLTLTEAYMCEAVENFAPVNPAVVFSISAESVCCFSAFEPVPEKTIIYHKWYRKDRLSTTQTLSIEPPSWKTYSSIQLREADKGPWKVEIIGPKGQIMKILRFSITD